MGLIITTADFSGSQAGQFRISQADKADSMLDNCIDTHEENILRSLLGVELFNLFKTDLASNSVTTLSTPYQLIYDEIHEDNGGCQMNSMGIKKILIACIWFEFMRIQPVKNTTSGNVNNKSDISEKATSDKWHICRVYNQAEEWWQAVQWFIQDNISDYESFNGQCFDRADYL